MNSYPSSNQKPKKTDAGNGSKAICRVCNVHPSPPPVPQPSVGSTLKGVLLCLVASAVFNATGVLAGEALDGGGSAADAQATRAMEGAWYCVSNSMARGSSMIYFEADGNVIETSIHERKTGDRFLGSWKIFNQTVRIENRRWFRREEWPLTDAFWPKRAEWRILRLHDGILSVDVSTQGERSPRVYVREAQLATFERRVVEFTGDDGKLRLIWDNTDKPNHPKEDLLRAKWDRSEAEFQGFSVLRVFRDFDGQ